MAKIPRRNISEAVAAHMYYTDVHGTKEYVRDRKQYVRSVASYLLETGRTRDLDSILRDISADWARIGYVEVLAHTAHSLTEDVRKQIETHVKKLYPKAEKVMIAEVPDPSVLGGVRLHIADRVLDLSAAGKLNKFKQLTGAGKD